MLNCFVTASQKHPVEITLVTPDHYEQWLAVQPEAVKQFLAVTQFAAQVGDIRIVPDESKALARVIACVSQIEHYWCVGHLPLQLPEGIYALNAASATIETHAIAWGLGAYQFTRYKRAARSPAQLLVPPSHLAHVSNMVESIYFVRDLINTPAE